MEGTSQSNIIQGFVQHTNNNSFCDTKLMTQWEKPDLKEASDFKIRIENPYGVSNKNNRSDFIQTSVDCN